MPEIQIPNSVIVGLQVILAFVGAFALALWVSLIIWTFRDVRSRSRDVFAVLLATLMVVIFGPLGLLLYLLLRPPDTLADLYERSLEEEALLQDLEERAVCPGCRRKIETDWQVCPDCHTILKKKCLNCGELLNLRWNICPYCVAPAIEVTEHKHVGHTQPEPVSQAQGVGEAGLASGLASEEEWDVQPPEPIQDDWNVGYAPAPSAGGIESTASDWEIEPDLSVEDALGVSEDWDLSGAPGTIEPEEVDSTQAFQVQEDELFRDTGPIEPEEGDVFPAESADTLTGIKLPPNPESPPEPDEAG